MNFQLTEIENEIVELITTKTKIRVQESLLKQCTQPVIELNKQLNDITNFLIGSVYDECLFKDDADLVLDIYLKFSQAKTVKQFLHDLENLVKAENVNDEYKPIHEKGVCHDNSNEDSIESEVGFVDTDLVNY